MAPFVTVVITTYNQESLIEATVQSALAQTYEHREVIVVDDGSTDGTPARLAAFGDRIVYIRRKNGGVAESRNTGVRRARGDLVAFLDGDDLWEPDKLAVQVEAHRRFPHAGMIVVDACSFNGADVIHPSTLNCAADDFMESFSDVRVCAPSYRALLPHNFIMTTSQVMVPAPVLAEVGFSDSSLRIGSDYDLYLRIARRYELAFVKRVLTRWRYSPTSVSGPAALRPFRCGVEEIKVLRKQLAGAVPDIRQMVLALLRKKSWVTARAAYYYGLETDRAFSRRFLPGLWHANRRSIWPLIYWTALMHPPELQAPLKSLFNIVVPRRRRRFPEAS
jgi:glycosyltransferase involved in cell wall biosynthesis